MTLSPPDPAHGDCAQYDEWALSARISRAPANNGGDRAGWLGRGSNPAHIPRRASFLRNGSWCNAILINHLRATSLSWRADPPAVAAPVRQGLLELREHIPGDRIADLK
jgi:hypothetical protein